MFEFEINVKVKFTNFMKTVKTVDHLNYKPKTIIILKESNIKFLYKKTISKQF